MVEKVKITPLTPPFFSLSFPYNPKLVAECKTTPGLVWVPEKRVWKGYWDAVESFCGKIGQPTTAPEGIGGSTEGVIMAGPDKDAKALELTDFLITTKLPAVLVLSVENKEKWKGKGGNAIFDVHVIDGKKGAQLPSADLYIINYEILEGWKEWLMLAAPTIIFDLQQGNKLAGAESGRSKAAKEIAAGMVHRIALTPTLIPTQPRDLWNIVDIISPGRFGSFYSFGRRFCGGFQQEVNKYGYSGPKMVWNFDGRSNLEELEGRLRWFCEVYGEVEEKGEDDLSDLFEGLK